jgi:hypothetical protein
MERQLVGGEIQAPPAELTEVDLAGLLQGQSFRDPLQWPNQGDDQAREHSDQIVILQD